MDDYERGREAERSSMFDKVYSARGNEVRVKGGPKLGGLKCILCKIRMRKGDGTKFCGQCEDQIYA